MNIDQFIIDRSQYINVGTIGAENQYSLVVKDAWIDQITFDIIHNIDKAHNHVHDWYKDLRINKLFEYFITSGIFTKKQVLYKFELHKEPTDFAFDFDKVLEHMRLCRFEIQDLSLTELMSVSNVLPAPDILQHVEIDISKPYTSVKNKNLDCYKLTGKM